MRGGAVIQRRRGRLGVVLLAVACGIGALALTGCGASSVVDPVAKAATVSNQAPGLRMNLRMRLSTAGLSAPILVTGNGSFDTPQRSGSLDVAMNFGNIPQLAQVLGSSTLQMQEILDQTVVYLKLPAALERNLPVRGKTWMKIDLARAAQSLGVSGISSLLGNPTSSDPTQFLRYLRAESGSVTQVATAQSVDGFTTTEYRARIDLNRVSSALPAADRTQAQRAIAQLEQLTHLRLVPVTVWVDGQHLVRRMELSFSENVSGQSLTADMTLDFPQYGPQPPPQLPPASQVADLTGQLAPGG